MLQVESLADPYRYQIAHRALPKLLFSMTKGLFDLMGGREVEGVTWESMFELMVLDAQLRSKQEG